MRTTTTGFRLALATVIVLIGISSPWSTTHAVVLTDDDSILEFGSPPTTFQLTGGPNFPGWHSYFRSYWYRVGTTGPESPASDLTLTETVLFDRDSNGDDDAVRFDFEDAAGRFRFSTGFVLDDRGTRTFVEESIIINNLTTAPLDFHLFLFSESDLDLSLSIESPADYDSAFHTAKNTIQQTSPRGTVITTFVTSGQSPNKYELAESQCFFIPELSCTDPIGRSLKDSSPTTLATETTVKSELRDIPNLQWAWQWDFSIPDGMIGVPTQFIAVRNRVGSVTVYEPGVLGLFAFGLFGVLFTKRRRLRSQQTTRQHYRTRC